MTVKLNGGLTLRKSLTRQKAKSLEFSGARWRLIECEATAKHGALLAFTIIQKSPCQSLLYVSILSSVSRCVEEKEKSRSDSGDR